MNVVIFCEFSGRMRDAFIARGHDAMSCDLLPSDRPGPHYQGDAYEVMTIIREGILRPDLVIAHPPCTFLTNAANRWLTDPRYPNRIQDRDNAVAFFNDFLTLPVAHICVENPVPNGYLTARVGKYTQTIQPYHFGENVSKRTCLWLKNLPLLTPTEYVEPDWTSGNPRWGNQSPSGVDRTPPSPDRWKLRSTTFQGIADAMADQWSNWIEAEALKERSDV